jgi:lipid II:glycine glycyltransferase (peptidoglycan interpeptide bridge formation enzyme)
LQTWEWGQVKSVYGWQPLPQVWRDESGRVVAAALVLARSLPLRGFAARLQVLYVPKGPLCNWGDAVLRRRVLGDLADLARRRGAIFIKIDPDVALGTGIPGQPEAIEDPVGQAMVADLLACGWHLSAEQVQFRNTVCVDLTPPLNELLAGLKQKTRYNIRLAERKGVSVRIGELPDLPQLYRMYAETSARDGFVIRDEGYYQTVWSTFMEAGMAVPLVAEVGGEMAAALILFSFAGKAWFLYGMSSDQHREKMPNYLLQWEAIRRAKENGCQTYDLWGAPDAFEGSDPLWGVYRFKEGFNGQVVRHIGAWDLPVRPAYYRLYTQTLPRILDVMRRRGKKRTREMVG